MEPATAPPLPSTALSTALGGRDLALVTEPTFVAVPATASHPAVVYKGALLLQPLLSFARFEALHPGDEKAAKDAAAAAAMPPPPGSPLPADAHFDAALIAATEKFRVTQVRTNPSFLLLLCLP